MLKNTFTVSVVPAVLVIRGDAISFVGPKDWKSFKNVEAFLKQEISFSTIDGLEGKFKGLKPAPKKKFVQKKPTAKKPVAKKTDSAKPKKKMDKRFYDNMAVGDNVFVPKKKKPVNPSAED